MSNFVELIEKHTHNRQILLDSLIDDGLFGVFCPNCLSIAIIRHGGSCTLVGTIGGNDPNHYWSGATCKDCKHTFHYQHHLWYSNPPKTNIWYTEGEKQEIVIMGIHNCCSGKYECKCGGIIDTITTALDGVTKQDWKSFSYNSKTFREFIVCNSCGLKEEVIE